MTGQRPSLTNLGRLALTTVLVSLLAMMFLPGLVVRYDYATISTGDYIFTRGNAAGARPNAGEVIAVHDRAVTILDLEGDRRRVPLGRIVMEK